MDKMALFVEGQTEQEFVKRLVEHIAGAHKIHIDAVKAIGGRTMARKYIEVTATKRPDPAKKYYVLIYDCTNNSRVLSDIRDQYESLTSQGYREIIGIRDVLPSPNADIPKIRANFRALAPKNPFEPVLVLSIREIEAWFICEHTHFERQHKSLTRAKITAKLGYDPSIHDVQTIPSPAKDLKAAYSIAKLSYNKSRKTIERTVEHLDYDRIYLEMKGRIPDLTYIPRIPMWISRWFRWRFSGRTRQVSGPGVG